VEDTTGGDMLYEDFPNLQTADGTKLAIFLKVVFMKATAASLKRLYTDVNGHPSSMRALLEDMLDLRRDLESICRFFEKKDAFQHSYVSTHKGTGPRWSINVSFLRRSSTCRVTFSVLLKNNQWVVE